MEETKLKEVKKKGKDIIVREDRLNLISYEGVKQFKSIRRAIRKGYVSPEGIIYPRRPYNNRKNRPVEQIKRKIYERFKNAHN